MRIIAGDVKGSRANLAKTGLTIANAFYVPRETIPYSNIESYTVSDRKEYDVHLMLRVAFVLGAIFAIVFRDVEVIGGWLGAVLGAQLAACRLLTIVELRLNDGRRLTCSMYGLEWKLLQTKIAGRM